MRTLIRFKKGLLAVSVLLLCLVFFLPTLAGMQQVKDLFGHGNYEEARQLLKTGSDDHRPGEEALWTSRLFAEPGAVADLLIEKIKDTGIPETTRQGMSLQLAQIHFARGQYTKTHTVLNELITASPQNLPGEVYLLAGLTQRTSGNLQAAREMFASVKPEDNAFAAARYYLGDIGLENNDHELALRYFESGQKNATEEEFSRLKSGQWRALRAAGKDQEAEIILGELRRDSASSLALVEIGRVLQIEDDKNSARVAAILEAQADSIATRPPETTGRYSLQVGAFSDRGLALEFKNQHQETIPGLSITQIRDNRGQFLYKLRFGSYVNPALARSEAQRQKNKLGIDVIVVELSLTDSEH